MKFKDTLNRKNLYKHTSPSGSPIQGILKWRFNEDGDFVRVLTEKRNLYDEIQAARDSVDLQRMLERYESGDETALNKVQGMYIDTKDMPKNYHELYASISLHNEVFDSMPVEIKEKYHNSPAEYWKAFGTKEFDETLNAFRAEVYAKYGMADDNPVNTSGEIEVKKVESEVIENE